MAFFNNEDLNGECFIAGELGEVEEVSAERVVYIPDGLPSANAPYQAVALTSDQTATFINENFYRLKDANNALTDGDCAKIAFIRFLAVRTGLISDKFDHNAFFCKYSETVRLGAQPVGGAWLTANPHDGNAAVIHQVPRGVLTDDIRKQLRKDFTDMVCCVAYMFRVRGHHWVADMNDKYRDLWKKCLRANETPGVDWQYIAHNALHAVYPTILDDFWIDAVQNSNIAGALMKRLDSAPAGVAGVKALDTGMNDLAITVPGFKNQFHDLYKEKNRLIEQLKVERWAGSINRRFYNAGDLGFDESRFAAIASTILSALNQFAVSSPLRNSAALKRMAASAPIAGGFTARLIAAAANDPDNAKALVNAKATI